MKRFQGAEILLISTLMLTLFLGCPPCEPDEFGEEMRLIVPINFGSATPIYHVGDTLWVESRFSKDVEVLGHESLIFLENFRFFSSFYISEISQMDLRLFVSRNIVEEIGILEVNPNNTYAITFEESDTNYTFKAGIVLEIPGNYHAGASMDVDARSGYDHPSFYSCEDNSRSFVGTIHKNIFTSRENLELFHALNNVMVGDFVQTYDGYEKSASFTFQVLE